MVNLFNEQPILNSPYEPPTRHWELDERRQPTGQVAETRRRTEFFIPIPKPKKGAANQAQLDIDPSARQPQSDIERLVGEVRRQVEAWRSQPNPDDWRVTPETARLLQHWRHHDFSHLRPFFCQVEAVETVIWLTEVAPKSGPAAASILKRLEDASREANPELLRWALKLATGAGKTTVMAMIIAWQTVNAVRRPNSRNFTKGFLVVAPGITIKDRLRVLRPNDPDSYYASRELVPNDLLPDLGRAEIVITNYHAFMLRDRLDLSSGGRALLQGRGPALNTKETEGQMLSRVMGKLMSMKGVWVLNDEGHHCYRHKPGEDEEGALQGDEKREAEKNSEAARVWISGLEAVKRRIGVRQVVDLSATPFFLRGSGYPEGSLFPWTVSDFSLMDAIECGIVKLPRVPVADNIPGGDMPKYRVLWETIRADMPKSGRGKAKGESLDPLALPTRLQTALEALYGHYRKTYDNWREAGIPVPPCFIIVCNNTSTSKLVYDYVSGFHRTNEDGANALVPGRLELFRNYDEQGNPYPIPRTVLIDSTQLESGEALNTEFRKAAADQIDRFRRERAQRGGPHDADKITDHDLLREVMNTVGKEERLGQDIRCVVSVSMLTEGWDANTVTHVLGVRAFGTQLLCEQVVGRALRRYSYDLNDEGLFETEYADVLGVPFDFTANPVVVKPLLPRRTVQVKAASPERDHLEIRFPRVAGYRADPPRDELAAEFTDDSRLLLTPDMVGPTDTRVEGIIGEGVDLNLVHTGSLRTSALAYHLTQRLLSTKWRDLNGDPKLHLFGRLKAIVLEWLDGYLVCKGGAYPAQLMYQELADRACERIAAAIVNSSAGQHPVKALLDPFNPTGSTVHVNFNTSKADLWRTDARKCHVNYVVYDSDWEAEFCRVAEAHPKVRAYAKNHGLGLEVPYLDGALARTYLPDFIVEVDDGRGADDPLRLVVEIKGYRNEAARAKKGTMETYWIPAVNDLRRYGRWAFAEFRSVYDIAEDFDALIARACTEALRPAG